MDPISPYGHSKLLAEGVLHDAHEPNRFNFCVLRYFNAAGADPAGRAGQSTEKATHLMKVCVEAAVGKRPVIPVYGTDYPTADGTCMRDYVHVSDLADAHVAALEALVARPSESWVLNCGYGHGFSVLQVLDKMDEVANMKIRRRIEPRRPGDPASLIADNSRITATLDWTPRYADLSQIIAHSLAWERLHTAKLATQV